MRRFIRLAMTAIFLLSMLGWSPGVTLAQTNVNGNVYTSPTFGYQLQWSDPWVYIEDSSESGADFLLLSSGLSDAGFILAFAPLLTLDDFVTMVMGESTEGVSDVQPSLDPQGIPIEGVDGPREWALYTGMQDFGDGQPIEFYQYISLQPLEGGVVLVMTGTTVSYFWDDTSLQSFHDLANSILGGQPVPDPVPTSGPPAPTTAPIEPTAPAQATETPMPTATTSSAPPIPDNDRNGGGAGEPAPAFAAGPWRVAARAVDIGETIDYLGLGFVEGQQWIVVYADVTNWSDAEAQLDIASWQLATASGLIAPDTTGTQSAASSLGLEPANGSSVTVPAGGSERLALVYSIPASETELILQIGDAQLPLENAVGTQLDVTDLTTIAEPPALIEGTMSVISIGGTGAEFHVETSAGAPLISLAGVEIPTDLACFDSGSALLVINDQLGQRLWLEADPAITEPDTYYVWYEDAQGNRVLLNQQVIAEGVALEGDLPEAARFGAWLEQTEAVAEANGVGQWSTCAGQI
jgi:hypothetical protein